MGASSCNCKNYDLTEDEVTIGHGMYDFKKIVNKIF